MLFLHSQDDSSPYYHHHDLYYPYNDPEASYALTGSVTSQSRPFSASSSSCSSIESSAENTHHYSHSSTLNPLVGVSASINPQSVTDFSLSNSCFSTHSPSHHPAPNWGNANLHHHEFKHEFSHHTPHGAGYTSVIVDSQQYQLANEYVH